MVITDASSADAASMRSLAKEATERCTRDLRGVRVQREETVVRLWDGSLAKCKAHTPEPILPPFHKSMYIWSD